MSLGKVTTLGPGTTYLRPELQNVKIIGVEEHLVFPDIMKELPDAGPAGYAMAVSRTLAAHEALAYAAGRATDAGAQRLSDMDGAGIAMQVLSFGSAVNTTHASPALGLRMAREINDRLKQAVDANPSRFKALAELPVQNTGLAIEELRRCVNKLGFVGAMIAGSIGGKGKFLDAPEFDELLTEFEVLDVPLYLHPGITPEPVQEMYYDIPGNPLASAAMGAMGWGWHNEVAIHVMRLAVAGTLEKHPKLKIVVGHQGEMMPMMMQRFDVFLDPKVTGLKRSVGETLREQVWIAVSDRVLFANDYPFVDAQRVPDYVKALNDIVAPSDMRKILQTNTEELFKFKA